MVMKLPKLIYSPKVSKPLKVPNLWRVCYSPNMCRYVLYGKKFNEGKIDKIEKFW